MIPGGLGLARLANGLVVMVPYVLPGEKVKVAIGQTKKGYAKASLLEILEPSPFRVPPPCPHYGECGGCDFQHIAYPHQLALKHDLLKEQLQHTVIAKDGQMQLEFDDISASPEAFFYRQRIRLQVQHGKLGFYRHSSHQIVELSECLLASPPINNVLNLCKGSKDFFVLLKNCSAIELKLSPKDDGVIVILHFERKPRPKDISAAKALAATISGVKSLLLQTTKWGIFGPFFREKRLDEKKSSSLDFTFPLSARQVTMSLEAGGFCQVNSSQNVKLINTVLAWAKIGSDDKVLDLFCGMGNFSVPIALSAGSILGTDLQRSAIRSAKLNAHKNGLDNCTFQQKSAVDLAAELAAAGSSFDLVILDPPRQGCREVIPHLQKINAAHLIYIACDPATLARDLAELVQCGYKINKVQGVDMFPQTHHIETVVLLDRKEGGAIGN